MPFSDASGKSKCNGCELGGRLLNIWYFVVTILLRTVLRWTRCLLHSLEGTKGAGWSLEQFWQYSIDHPRLRYVLANLSRDHRAEEQLMLQGCIQDFWKGAKKWKKWSHPLLIQPHPYIIYFHTRKNLHTRKYLRTRNFGSAKLLQLRRTFRLIGSICSLISAEGATAHKAPFKSTAGLQSKVTQPVRTLCS